MSEMVCWRLTVYEGCKCEVEAKEEAGKEEKTKGRRQKRSDEW